MLTKIKYHFSHFAGLLLIGSLLASSCKKFVDVPPPANQIVSSELFKSESNANSAVIGLYAQMMGSSLRFFNGAASIFAALSADELNYTGSTALISQFKTNDILNTNTQVLQMWGDAYSYIYQANSCIEGLQKSTTIKDSARKSLIAECKFIRAFLYFQLSNFFGKVPLILTTSINTNISLDRTPIEVINQQIVTDLEEAQDDISIVYPATGGRVRPTKLVVKAFLAKVYLYQQNWAKAESAASTVITSGVYSLLSTSNLINVFLATSNEAIWQLKPTLSNVNTVEGNLFVPASATALPAFPLTTSLLNAFAPTDQRKTAWLKSNTVSSQTYFYPNKYKVRSGAPPYTEYNMVFRLAEQYLIRAEARAQQNNIADATTDLNAIRNRAGLTNTTATDKPSLLLAIEQERQVELFAEWGNRWLDLKRTSRADAVLAPIKGANWQATDTLYPIPLSQIQLNTNLEQNLGYN